MAVRVSHSVKVLNMKVMRNHKGVIALVARSESEGRCCYGLGEAQNRALRRRRDSGELISPYPGVYARSEYWHALNPPEQSRHLIKALAMMHPQWVFAELSAATVLRFEHSWGLHADGCVHIATNGSVRVHGHDKLRRLSVHNAAIWRCDEVRITSPARTLVDCARYPFERGLPIFDSALRSKMVSRDEVRVACHGLRVNLDSVERLLRYANPLSENGGESLCRAIIIDAGFALPILQEEFIDPNDARVRYRVNFLWRLFDGRVIVLEFDGSAKYTDPQMTGRRSTERIVFEERNRENALRRAGVTTIVRVNYSELMDKAVLIRKLELAGVPRPFASR